MGTDIRWEKDITLHQDKEEEIYSLLLRQEGDLKEVIEKIPDKKAITLPLKPGTYNLDGYTIKNKKLTFKGLGEVNIIGSINIEGSEVIFENIKFEGISAKGSKVVFKNCKGKGIYGTASQITINNSEIHGNEERGIEVVENSTLEIKDSKVYENGTKVKAYAHIYIENSKADISNSQVYNGIGLRGIYGEASHVTINNSEVYGHYSNGIYIFNSTLSMKGSQVYKNGAGESQIDIYGKCQVTVRDTHVYNSKGDYGIWIEKSGSKVELINVKTWGNKYGLKCNEYGTSVKIQNCEFRDGTWGL
jgi:hypothetical protein